MLTFSLFSAFFAVSRSLERERLRTFQQPLCVHFHFFPSVISSRRFLQFFTSTKTEKVIFAFQNHFWNEWISRRGFNAEYDRLLSGCKNCYHGNETLPRRKNRSQRRLCGFNFQCCHEKSRLFDSGNKTAKKKESKKLQQMDYKEGLLNVIMIIPFNHSL